MSDMSKKARAANRAKANSLGGGANDPHKRVDASSWKPNENLNADRKTGARPIRARIYKAGGKIQGDRGPVRADKTPRGGKASGGALTVHNTVDENKRKLGSYHEGGYKSGGRTKRDMGGMADPREAAAQTMAAGAARSGVPQGRFNVASSGKSPYLRKGGSAKAKRFCAGGMAEGGRPLPAGKMSGKAGKHSERGEATTLRRMSAIPQDEAVKHKNHRTGRANGGPTYNKEAVDKEIRKDKRIKGKESSAIHRLLRGRTDAPYNPPREFGAGNSATADDRSKLRGMLGGDADEQKRGGRTKRKAGGRAKGKTNINIIIGRGGNEQPQLPPQGVVRPPAPPPPMPPPGGPPPGGPPPGLAGPPPGMPSGIPPGMPRKRGGRTYKDMDAGAQSGLGRIEKSDIQASKR